MTLQEQAHAKSAAELAAIVRLNCNAHWREVAIRELELRAQRADTLYGRRDAFPPHSPNPAPWGCT